MKVLRPVVVALALAGTSVLCRPAPLGATIIGGGGSTLSDCLVVFDAPVNTPPRKPRNIRCADGDACDADGTVNGVCTFPIAMCANSTYNPGGCSLTGVRLVSVDHADDNGDTKFDPEFLALETRFHTDIGAPPTIDALDQCFTAPTNIHVTIKGPFAGNKCKKNKKRIKVVSESKVIGGKIFVDTDTITLTCDPARRCKGGANDGAECHGSDTECPGGVCSLLSGCDPQVFYSSTFDRIQTQIFNQSCAVSGCHDSQSKQADLLLETGASLTQLINVTPTTMPAANLGWKRVTQIDPMTGDPDTSFIVHKINGDFPGPGFGDRMPKGHKKLDQTLIDVITLWVAAGAPDMGWVPGTF